VQTPTEFGYKVSIAETSEGSWSHTKSSPPHHTQTLKPALQAAKATGMKLKSVFADRGYGNETAGRRQDRPQRRVDHSAASGQPAPAVRASEPRKRPRPCWGKTSRGRAQ
jgi:hypothetical protein